MSQATDMVALYIKAEIAILEGKEFQLNDRRVAREDLVEVRNGRKEWELRVNRENIRATNKGINSTATWGGDEYFR
jgi:hypothetical protein